MLKRIRDLFLNPFDAPRQLARDSPSLAPLELYARDDLTSRNYSSNAFRWSGALPTKQMTIPSVCTDAVSADGSALVPYTVATSQTCFSTNMILRYS